jgi:hypothetical protein
LIESPPPEAEAIALRATFSSPPVGVGLAAASAVGGTGEAVAAVVALIGAVDAVVGVTGADVAT